MMAVMPDSDISAAAPAVLAALGWDAGRAAEAAALDPTAYVGRVAVRHSRFCDLLTADGWRRVRLPARLLTAAADGGGPVVGDWLLWRPQGDDGAAEALLSRRSVIVRQEAGRGLRAQAVAANLDRLFIVTSLDRDFNLRRLERWLALVWDSGAAPVIVIGKADLVGDEAAGAALAAVGEIAPGVPVLTVSTVDGRGLAELHRLASGCTVAFVGSSGVGKSSLVNAILGDERLRVGAVRAHDGRGQHTTSVRELVPLPGGGALIDTPGVRELQLWADDEALESTFADVAALAADCRFADCCHEGEPGCAVAGALADGTLDAERLTGYRKLQGELAALDRRVDPEARRAAKAKDREIAKRIKQLYKDRGR